MLMPASSTAPRRRCASSRDVTRKIEGDDWLQSKVAWLLNLARRVHEQERGQSGPKVYSLHAPEVECIGKGKARAPYEFSCKISIVTAASRQL